MNIDIDDTPFAGMAADAPNFQKLDAVDADEAGVLDHMESKRALYLRLESDPEFKKQYLAQQAEEQIVKLAAAYTNAKIAEQTPAPAEAPAKPAPQRVRTQRILTQEQLDNIPPDTPLDDLTVNTDLASLREFGIHIGHVTNLTINIARGNQ